MYNLPNPFIPDTEKNEDYYKKCVEAIANYAYYNLDYSILKQAQPNKEGIDNTLYFSRFIRYYQYAFGLQENQNYKYITEKLPNVPEVGKWIQGQHIYRLIMTILGIWDRKFDTLDMTVKNASKRYTMYQREVQAKLKVELELRAIIDQAEQELGIPLYGTIAGLRPHTPEEVEDYMANEFNDYMALLCERLLQDHISFQDFKSITRRALFNWLCTGICAIETKITNGLISDDVINPINLIYDATPENDYNLGGGFAGRVDYLTASELMSRYKLTKDEIKQVQEMWMGGGIINYSPNTTLPTYWYLTANTVPRYAVVNVYWKDFSKMDYLKSEDKAGNEYTELINKNELSKSGKKKRLNKQEDSKYIECILQGTLIGGCILKNWGKATNQVRTNSAWSKTSLPISVFTPFSVFGTTMGLIERTMQYQDRIDLYQYKIQQAVSRDKGLVPAFDIANFPEGYDLSRIMEDISLHGATVFDSTRPEDENARGKSPYIIMNQLMLDGNSVQTYLMLIEQTRVEMDNIAGISAMEQGQPIQYVGKEVAKQVASAGQLMNLNYMNMFARFLELKLTYDVNTIKLLCLMFPETAKYNVSEMELSALKALGETAFEDIKIYLDIDNGLDSAGKQQITDLLFASMQNSGIDIDLAIDILGAKTRREAQSLGKVANKRAQQKAQEEALRQQQMLEEQTDSKLEETMLREGSANERQQMKSQDNQRQQELDATKFAYDTALREEELDNQEMEQGLSYE